MTARGRCGDRRWLATACLALVACLQDEGDSLAASASTPPTLRDTTGAMFEVVGGDLEQLRPLGDAGLADVTCLGVNLPVGEALLWLGKTGLPMLCFEDPESRGPLDFTCRPVACGAVEECLAGAACVSGRCHYVYAPYVADPARIDDLELAAMCAAEVPRGGECPFADPDYAKVAVLVDAACSSADRLCEVPAECKP